MCFSATASLTAGAGLAIGGLYAMRQSSRSIPQAMPLAALPLAFGVQQLLEGGVWVSLQTGAVPAGQVFALGFLFFSHCFWLFWVPFSIFWLEERPVPKQILLGITIAGGVLGTSLYLPLLINNWVQVAIAQGHITYDVRLIYSDLIPWSWGRIFYAAIVLVPFFLSQRLAVNGLGGLIGLSIAITIGLYESRFFISIWCFFAAIISTYLIYWLRAFPTPETPSTAGDCDYGISEAGEGQ